MGCPGALQFPATAVKDRRGNHQEQKSERHQRTHGSAPRVSRIEQGHRGRHRQHHRTQKLGGTQQSKQRNGEGIDPLSPGTSQRLDRGGQLRPSRPGKHPGEYQRHNDGNDPKDSRHDGPFSTWHILVLYPTTLRHTPLSFEGTP